MTTLKQISDKLNGKLQTDFFKNMMDIDIGDHTFDNVKQHDKEGFLYLYTSKKEPNVKLLFNEDRAAAILYELQDDGEKVKTTSWRMGKKFTKTFNKDELNNIF